MDIKSSCTPSSTANRTQLLQILLSRVSSSTNRCEETSKVQKEKKKNAKRKKKCKKLPHQHPPLECKEAPNLSRLTLTVQTTAASPTHQHQRLHSAQQPAAHSLYQQ